MSEKRGQKSHYVYVIGAVEGCHKIGHSHDPKARLKWMKCLPVVLAVVKSIPTTDPEWLEEYLHQVFAAKHVRGEWFRLDSDDLALVGAIDGPVNSLSNVPKNLAAACQKSYQERGAFYLHTRHGQRYQFRTPEDEEAVRWFIHGKKWIHDHFFDKCLDQACSGSVPTLPGESVIEVAIRLLVALAKEQRQMTIAASKNGKVAGRVAKS